MKTIQFKTNIKCGGCVAAVTPFLATEGVEKWNVELENPNRILTVTTDKSAEEIEKLVKEAGYNATSLT